MRRAVATHKPRAAATIKAMATVLLATQLHGAVIAVHNGAATRLGMAVVTAALHFVDPLQPHQHQHLQLPTNSRELI